MCVYLARGGLVLIGNRLNLPVNLAPLFRREQCPDVLRVNVPLAVLRNGIPHFPHGSLIPKRGKVQEKQHL